MIESARVFAIESHGPQKYGKYPYAVHLDAVSKLTQEYGEIAQTVAYLHDVVEDTPVQLSTIEHMFGKFVAECVAILTDEPGDNRKERKKKTYSKMSKVSGDLELALIVKAADRLANMNACISDGKRARLDMYKNEHTAFRESVFRDGLCDDLWCAMEGICGIPVKKDKSTASEK